MNSKLIEVGERLRDDRERRGFTLYSAGLGAGIPPRRLSRIERGLVRATFGEVDDLAQLYGRERHFYACHNGYGQYRDELIFASNGLSQVECIIATDFIRGLQMPSIKKSKTRKEKLKVLGLYLTKRKMK